jgi:hypothetical protein
MGRQKRNEKHSSPKNILIQDSEGNEENGYPVPNSNKIKINNAKEPNNAYKNILKKKFCKQSLRISWRCYWTCSTKMNKSPKNTKVKQKTL